MKYLNKFVLASLIAMVVTVGCRSLDKSGVYKGDKILYHSELSIVTSYEFFDAYVKWEKEHREALSKWPEIRQSADNIRKNAKQWFATANGAHDAYESDPSEANRNNLTIALGVIRFAFAEASGYMLKTATKNE